MKNFKNKLSLIAILALSMVMLFAVPAEAKTAKYKKLYKKFLSKGAYTITDTYYRMNSRTGKYQKATTKTKLKISKYAVINLDQKGAPELLLFSKYYSGKNAYNPNAYNASVAYIKGNKVKIAPFSEYVIKAGKKSYKNTLYSEYFTLRENAVRFSAGTKTLLCNSAYYYYDTDIKKVIKEEYEGYYTYQSGKMTYFEGDESKIDKTGFKKIGLLANSKKNRNKSFK